MVDNGVVSKLFELRKSPLFYEYYNNGCQSIEIEISDGAQVARACVILLY